MVLTVTFASIRVCHLRTSERSLSEVKSRPWKLVRQFFPCTSSDAEFDFAEGVVFVVLKVGERDFEDTAFEGVAGGFQTGRAVDEGFADTVAIDVNCVVFKLLLFLSVYDSEGLRTYSRVLNVEGALIEYQSFRVKGSIVLLQRFSGLAVMPLSEGYQLRRISGKTYFLRPFLPFDKRLFLPTAMIATVV